MAELQKRTTRPDIKLSPELAQRLLLARKGNLQKALDLFCNYVDRFTKLNLLHIDPEEINTYRQLSVGKFCLPVRTNNKTHTQNANNNDSNESQIEHELAPSC